MQNTSRPDDVGYGGPKSPVPRRVGVLGIVASHNYYSLKRAFTSCSISSVDTPNGIIARNFPP